MSIERSRVHLGGNRHLACPWISEEELLAMDSMLLGRTVRKLQIKLVYIYRFSYLLARVNLRSVTTVTLHEIIC